jgi:hypothetical protein
MRSIETEGAAVRRSGGFALQALGAFLREAFVVLEAHRQTAEALPAFLCCAA